METLQQKIDRFHKEIAKVHALIDVQSQTEEAKRKLESAIDSMSRLKGNAFYTVEIKKQGEEDIRLLAATERVLSRAIANKEQAIKEQAIKELSLALAEREERIADLEHKVKYLEKCANTTLEVSEERKEYIEALEEVLRLKELELKQFQDN